MTLDLEMCVIRLSQGKRMSEAMAQKLDTVDIARIHGFRIPPDRPTEMHYHDFDEYRMEAA